MAYDPLLPEGVMLPAGFHVDTSDARYKALHELATRERWSQAAFSDVLGIEAKRVSAEHARASQAPAAPSPTPAPGPDFSKMSTSEKFHHALQQEAAKRAAGAKP
jgi:hypothetical protein